MNGFNTNQLEKYKILSLDGGGSWALVQAMTLGRIFGDIPGREILAHFDLVIANSGGSIVAAGLAENYRPSQLEDLFLNESIRKSIFYNLGFTQKSLITRITRLFGIGPKYSAEAKYNGLQKVLPELSKIPLTQVPALIPGKRNTQFMVTTYDYYRNRARFFRSNMKSFSKTANLSNRRKRNVPRNPDPATFVQAIHAATNAPVNYFDKPAKIQFETSRGIVERFFWDGAVGGYNNPVLAGVIEALSNGIAAENIHILSIGTGIKYLPKQDVFQSAYEELVIRFDKPTLTKDLVKMTASILSDPPDAASYTSYTIIAPDLPAKSERFVRLCPVIQPSLHLKDNVPTWDIPDEYTFPEFRDLLHLEMDAVEDKHVKLIQKMTQLWLENKTLNQPIRNDKYLRCLLGHNTFGEGLEDLKSWLP
ncbi:MAG TPA: hypothetical protein ENK85_05150 [Saprospiraceae bacterium]|nr:hypothetical protein [Saprospiraceae bacterium]